MKHWFLFPIVLFPFLLTSCHKDDEPETIPYRRTVLVYLAADNNLSSFALNDLKEMKEGMAQVSDGMLHLLVYIDTGSSPRLIELKKQNDEVVEDVIRTYDDRNSVGLDETREVFTDVFSNPDFKAEGYGLIYWSHADGWIPYGPSTRWVGQDTTDGTHYMNISELVTVLQSVPHLDFLMFDACFMASVEVAYELRSFTDYYIGSPTETPGPGAPYERLVPLMSAEQAAVEMSKAYFDFYYKIYKDGIGISSTHWTGGTSISVIRTDALEQLASLTARLLPEEEVDIDVLKEEVFDYDVRPRDYVGYFDLKQLMEQVLDDASYAAWIQTLNTAIADWNSTPKNYSQFVGMFSIPVKDTKGITHYIPGSSIQRDAAYRSLQWYRDAGLEKLGW
ncbi:clostripain-related cysteine peptidase [uncultured Bacteroides sp.]|uniref:clostripain-related cysteine peptidase n=1 Tax=uncultured Bacteroides sp. TaxID=162156 RepID=UPI00260DE00C|nr:clostripain-related cysteine peptidase [uncultured Bacteroides sp.]